MLELICKSNPLHHRLLASKITKQGVYKSSGYSGFDVIIGQKASQLFIELLGEAGHHARTAVNVASLPANALVEVEAVLELN